MRRVSSRQRLVSWDAFDATAQSDDDASDSGYETCYDCLASSHHSSFGLRDGDNHWLSMPPREIVAASPLEMENPSCAVAHAFPQLPTQEEQDKSPNGAVAGRKRDRRGSIGCAGMKKVVSFSSLVKEASMPGPATVVPADASELATPERNEENALGFVSNKIAREPAFLTPSPSSATIHLTWENSTVNMLELLQTSDNLCSLSKKEAPLTLNFTDIAEDAQLHILSYLRAPDLRAAAATCGAFWQLIMLRDGGSHLWLALCTEQWDLLSRIGPPDAITLRDDCRIPIATSPSCMLPKLGPFLAEHGSACKVNLSVLLGMSAASHPLDVDKIVFDPCKRPIVTRRGSHLHPSQRGGAEFRSFKMKEHPRSPSSDGEPTVGDEYIHQVVQFTGQVGSGDRCIRSDRPLPQVHDSASHRHCAHRKWHLPSAPSGSLFNFFCRSARGVGCAPNLRPFVSPYVTRKLDADGVEIDLTPRLVAYYEVTILPRDRAQEPLAKLDGPISVPPLLEDEDPSATDCVAVGVSTEAFRLRSKMPGWDVFSYGFHGDDGGIFHASGDMIRRFGPSFGAGDTVGCGVDYVSRGIFFTLNGDFLGYAWTGLAEGVMASDLYPTVGVDTNCPLVCNFGNRPFQFDFKTFSQQYKDVVECSLTHLRSTFSESERSCAEFRPNKFSHDSHHRSRVHSSNRGPRLFRGQT